MDNTVELVKETQGNKKIGEVEKANRE